MGLFIVEKIDIEFQTCNDCVHRQRWGAGTKVIQYCGILKSNRTNNGQKRIKCKTKACLSYQSIKL